MLCQSHNKNTSRPAATLAIIVASIPRVGPVSGAVAV